ncbi:methyl-accepting chemotaxis protein [Undibacterium sp. Dicai25W]|uniref:methyl-accepting chemotaxis protein n=1 Tax=Undibacterium sp. Dicai25W TaxID=3413034 RepID=UPI003BF348C1
MDSFTKQLSVGKRLGLGFALVLFLSLITTIIALTRLSNVAHATQELLNDPLTTERLVSDWYRNIHTGVRRTSAIAKSSDPSLASFFKEDQEESTRTSAVLQKSIESHLNSEREIALFKSISDSRKTYLDAREKVVTFKKADKAEEANQALEQDFLPASKIYVKKIEELLQLQREQINQHAAEIQSTYETSRILLIVLSVIAACLSGLCGWLITTSITKPLAEATNIAKKMAQGDLTDTVSIHREDEIGELMAAINGISVGLSHVIADVRQGTEAIHVAANEIASGNADLSSRTESQASSLEETASSMEELTSTVKQNADNAKQANQLVVTASGVALKGGDVVDQVVKTMGSIKESSYKIVDIISVIDGIAFQTNILALNAAVEAARAGEQGRGFAVVASEVRNLAQRSASAAKEIKHLIDDSVGKVEHGSTLVDHAGQTMKEIVTRVQHVADIMAEITSASQEQSSGIGQVNIAINEMDEMTQQNAALVEQAAAAAESMREQSTKLSHVVAQFKIAEQGYVQTQAQTAVASATKPAPATLRGKSAKKVLQLGATTKVGSRTKHTAKPVSNNNDWEEF